MNVNKHWPNLPLLLKFAFSFWVEINSFRQLWNWTVSVFFRWYSGSKIPFLQSIAQSCTIYTMVYLLMVLRDLLDHKRSDCRYQIKDNLSRGLRFADSDEAELSCSHQKASHLLVEILWTLTNKHNLFFVIHSGFKFNFNHLQVHFNNMSPCIASLLPFLCY